MQTEAASCARLGWRSKIRGKSARVLEDGVQATERHDYGQQNGCYDSYFEFRFGASKEAGVERCRGLCRSAKFS